MSKRFLFVGMAVILCAALLTWLVLFAMDWYIVRKARWTINDERRSELISEKYGPPTNATVQIEGVDLSRRVRLAIGGVGLASAEADQRVSDLVMIELRDARGLELVERQELEAVLRELRLTASGLVRANDAVRVGKLLRADWFLLGTSAVVNGTNVGVIRIVDARTGVMRDATMIATTEAAPAFATALARFVKQAREDAANPKAKTYLAIGGFEDLSLNSRQAAVPRELRSYLTAAYQNSGISMLEREFVSTLLREMYLDLAGLTEEGAAGDPKPMQSAYWMVDGSYQSYETTNLQVEVVLNVRRLFGRNERIELREQPGEPLFRSVKAAVDRVMERNRADLAISRETEVRSLMAHGKELARIGGSDYLDYIWSRYEGYNSDGQNESARRVRNAEEAVRAFETVLLLEPTNREARICLATCFRKYQIERMGEARNYYREIIDAPMEDRWSKVARQALVETFQWSDPDSRRQWLEMATEGTTNRVAIEFYQERAKRAAEDAIVKGGGSRQAEELAEVRLFESIKSFDDVIHGKSGTVSFAVGTDDFAKVYGKERARTVRRLVELFPRIKAQFPDAAPYLLATIVTFQTDTNAPIIAEFEQTLDWAAQHPTEIVCGSTIFWQHIRYEPYIWALKHRPALAVKILETLSRAAVTDQRADLGCDNDNKIALAYG